MISKIQQNKQFEMYQGMAKAIDAIDAFYAKEEKGAFPL